MKLIDSRIITDADVLNLSDFVELIEEHFKAGIADDVEYFNFRYGVHRIVAIMNMNKEDDIEFSIVRNCNMLITFINKKAEQQAIASVDFANFLKKGVVAKFKLYSKDDEEEMSIF